MRSNKKSFIGLFAFLILFSFFFYLLLKPSIQAKALSELETCQSVTDVRDNWDEYRKELKDNNEYIEKIREKLKSFNLSKEEIKEIKSWLPATKNINLIVVPDLSYRIIDTINNPQQFSRDTILLNQIWQSFAKTASNRGKMNSKDYLILDVTDDSQAQNKFQTIADELVFDLSKHKKNQVNKKFFVSKKEVFKNNINQLYQLAKNQTSGANFVNYFRRKLPSRIKKSNLSDDYRNILIIITDGYLETNYNDTAESISPNEKLLKLFAKSGDISGFDYPRISTQYSDLEVYLFEINERKIGQRQHFEGLEYWWTEWFNRMHVKKGEEKIFNPRQDAIQLTKEQINRIIAG